MQEQEQGQGESSPFIRAFIRMIRGEKPAEKVAGDVTPEAPKAPPLPEWAIAEIAKSGKDGFTQVAHGSDVLRVVQGKVTYNGREYVEMGDEWWFYYSGWDGDHGGKERNAAIGLAKSKWIVFDLVQRKCVFAQIEGSEKIECIQYSPNGAYLAVGSRDNAIYIYAVTDNGYKYSRVGKCQGHSSYITHLDWYVFIERFGEF